MSLRVIKSKGNRLSNVILDLDSTVINSLRPWDKQPKGLIGHHMKDDETDQTEYIVYERPHLQEFLDYLFANYRVAVWTAASKDYAIFIIEDILLQKKPDRKLEFFLFDYHGELCEKGGCDSPKDLQLVWNTFPGFNKDNTVIIDDYEAVYIPQMCNAYPIPPFLADAPDASRDVELVRLMQKMSSPNNGSCPTDNLITDSTLQKALAKAEASTQ
jgi:TFIIF-interacting CTD phosphatase-like protein